MGTCLCCAVLCSWLEQGVQWNWRRHPEPPLALKAEGLSAVTIGQLHNEKLLGQICIEGPEKYVHFDNTHL